MTFFRTYKLWMGFTTSCERSIAHEVIHGRLRRPDSGFRNYQPRIVREGFSGVEESHYGRGERREEIKRMKLSQLFKDTMAKVEQMLSNDLPIRSGEFSTPEIDMIKVKLGNLITTKPMIYVVNLTKKDFIRKKNKWLVKIHAWIKEHGGGTMIPASVEYEQEAFDIGEENLEAFEKENEGAKSILPKMIVQGYKELNLIYYFTAGEKEVRCWTVQEGALAPQAAGVIHTDFERGFIKAEVCSFEDFKSISTTNSMAEVKAAGKYRQEGKTYVVKDGDIIHFQFNVTAAKKK